jgi:hypothetical protein
VTAGDPDRDGTGEGQSQGEHPDHPKLDVDAAFAAIVAGWEADDGTRPWPDAENVEPPETAPTPGERPAASAHQPDQPPVDRRPVGLEPPAQPLALPEPVHPVEPLVPGLYADSDDEPDVEHERFVPPDPEPVPRADLITRSAWAGVVGGPCLLLLASLVWRDLPELLLLTAVGAFVAGFVTLVARMPHDRDGDDGDGAVV